MAGDWIKVRSDLIHDPKVMQMSDILGTDDPTTVGHLVLFWTWADSYVTSNDPTIPLSAARLDRHVGRSGFAAALRAVGWLDGRDGALLIPNYERHNSSSAKARALEAEAKRLRRDGKNSEEMSDTVSDNCPTNNGQNVRPEKRREEKKVKTTSLPPQPPEGAGVASGGGDLDYGKFPGFARFWDSYPARNGVRQGKAEAVKIWQRAKLEQQADKIVAHVEEMAKTADWRKDQGRFVPQARTYLNQRRWDDEIDAEAAQRTFSGIQQRNATDPDYSKGF